MSEFDNVDGCVNCKIKDFCSTFPDDKYSCENIMKMAGIIPDETMYESQVECQQYCELYESTYNPEDGSM